MRDRPSTSNCSSWAAIALLAVAVALLEWSTPLPIAADSLAGIVAACGTLGGVTWFYRKVRPNEQFATMCTALMQVLLFSALGAILSYLVARDDGPLWDDTFARWDRALGLDWLAFVRWIDARPWTVLPLRLAYASLIPQIILIVVALGFTAKLAELRAVMFASILCGMIVICVSGMVPAISNFAYLGLTSADFRHIDPWAGMVHMPDITALREGTMQVIRLGEMQGIITFPSYHAGLSAVTLWGFWLTRIGWIRCPGMLLAAATIVATPVDGGHYFVDVFAGIAVAVGSIAVAGRAVRWAPALPRLTASPFRRSHAASAR
ncbi:MAG: phosphatase PAP2 family protein [Pseudomonadota bacterium]|nr:phosphatase PAP2 family protein [Pseudomonadota bacterium]